MSVRGRPIRKATSVPNIHNVSMLCSIALEFEICAAFLFTVFYNWILAEKHLLHVLMTKQSRSCFIVSVIIAYLYCNGWNLSWMMDSTAKTFLSEENVEIFCSQYGVHFVDSNVTTTRLSRTSKCICWSFTELFSNWYTLANCCAHFLVIQAVLQANFCEISGYIFNILVCPWIFKNKCMMIFFDIRWFIV